MMQASLLATVYNNLCSPLPTKIRARHCLQPSVLATAYKDPWLPLPTKIRARQCLQRSVLATAYNDPCSPMPTTIRARHCLQQSVLTRTCKLQLHTANESWFWLKCVLCNGRLCITSRSVFFRETVYIDSVWSVPFPECECCICGMEFQRHHLIKSGISLILTS